jgi:hypothetical protein
MVLRDNFMAKSILDSFGRRTWLDLGMFFLLEGQQRAGEKREFITTWILRVLGSIALGLGMRPVWTGFLSLVFVSYQLVWVVSWLLVWKLLFCLWLLCLGVLAGFVPMWMDVRCVSCAYVSVFSSSLVLEFIHCVPLIWCLTMARIATLGLNSSSRS